MIDFFSSLPQYVQALCATLFTWGVTAAGASLVFFFKKINKNVLDAMLGFAAGVMVAASFWSLLLPAEEMCASLGFPASAVLLCGFLSGGAFLFLGDILLCRAAKRAKKREERTHLYPFSVRSNHFVRFNSRYARRANRAAMLVFSVTLHNIPEGLCIGVAFASLASGEQGAAFASACMLALGIGLQNFPEGAAVSVPLRREGASRKCAFFWGQISGAVEPLAGVLGALLVSYVRALLPFSLSFAAGAMIYVVVAELLPESGTAENKNVAALFTLVGFAVMMLLDTAL